MTSIVDTLPTVQYLAGTSVQKSTPKIIKVIDDNNTLIDQLPIRQEETCLTHSNGSDALTVLCLGKTDSSLRNTLDDYFKYEDIILILLSTIVQLQYWLSTNSSVKIASLIIQENINIQDIVFVSHPHKNIRSILIRCETNELLTLQRFSRSYTKIDGVYADDIRLLIKLVIDLALFSEELGDQQREDENNELGAQRHYDRALKLCALAKKL